jgi:hypothetical protein
MPSLPRRKPPPAVAIDRGMSAAYNAYRLHALGPCGLEEPGCALETPKVRGRTLQALAAASLLLKPRGMASAFFGFTGEDGAGSILRRALMHLPADLSYFRRYPGPSPKGHAELADIEGLRFLAERAEATPDWPDASCTQATWLLLDAPYYREASEASKAYLTHASQATARARRRGAFTVVWFDAAGFADGAYADFDHEAVDLHILSDFEVGQVSLQGSPLQFRANTTLILQSTSVLLQSSGGLFGKVQAEYTWPRADSTPGASTTDSAPPLAGFAKASTAPTVVGALLAHALFEIFAEDDIPRIDVHVERERLEMQPLHLGLGLQWAQLAANLSHRQDSGMIAESAKGEWLRSVEAAWQSQHPERFTLWGGRHVISR